MIATTGLVLALAAAVDPVVARDDATLSFDRLVVLDDGRWTGPSRLPPAGPVVPASASRRRSRC